MKNYEEVAESVFRRSEEIIAQNKRRRREMTINIGSAVGCLAVAGAVGIGVWKNAGRNANVVQSEGQLANDGKDFFGAGDTVVDHEYRVDTASGVSDNIIGTIPDLEPPEYPNLDEIDHNGPFPNPANGPGYATSCSDDGNSSGCTPASYGITIDRMPEVPLTGSHDAPENGTLVFSEPLKAALEKYGDTDGGDGSYWYQVRVEFYKDGKPVDVNSHEISKDEWERLCDKGFGLLMQETTNDERWFYLFCPKNLLDNFEVNGEYGYFMKLYFEDYPEEYYAPESEPVVYNGC